MKNFSLVVGLIIIGLLAACSVQPTQPASTLTPEIPSETVSQPTSPVPTQPAITSSLFFIYTDTNANLWVWNEATGARQITQTNDVVKALISPNNDQLILLRKIDADYSLWVAQPDGDDLRELVSAAQFREMAADSLQGVNAPENLQWVPGTSLLAFNTAQISQDSPLVYNNGIWVVNITTNQLKQLLSTPEAGMFHFSPSGEKLAIIQPDSISLVNSDSSNYHAKILTFSPVNAYTKSSYYPIPVWSADSSYLLMAIPPAEALNFPKQETQIWKIPADGSDPTLLSQFITAPLFWPYIAPDLSSIAYLAPTLDKPGIPITSLHIATPSGVSDIAYYTDQIKFLGWSPNSQHFLFNAGQNSLETVVGNLPELPVSLPGLSAASQVHWIDMQSFLFLSFQQSGYEIRRGNVQLANTLLIRIPSSGQSTPVIQDSSHP